MPLDIAIIGAGVGGLTLAVALQKNPNLRVNLYERASELKEIGALIGLAPNAIRTLEKLGVKAVLGKDFGWRNSNGIPMIFLHWKTGELLSIDRYHDVPESRHYFSRMHRARLQNALLEHIPPNSIHVGKKVVSVNADRLKGAVVTFEDKTTVKADLVVGADGIKSGVRRSFVPDHRLDWAGDVVFRSTFDYSLVADIPEIAQNSSHFTGPDGFFFGTRIGSGQFGVTASFPVDPALYPELNEPVWNAPATVEPLRQHFKHWNPVIPKIIERIPWVRRYANVVGRALEQWSFEDRVTLLGDAAHTHGGAFAAGAALAIDDAYALSLAFEEILPPDGRVDEPVSPETLGRILGLYEATRRPHTAKVLDIVHQTREKARVRKSTGLVESDEEFRHRVAHRLDPVWLTEHDVEAAFEKVAVQRRVKGAVHPIEQEQARL